MSKPGDKTVLAIVSEIMSKQTGMEALLDKLEFSVVYENQYPTQEVHFIELKKAYEDFIAACVCCGHVSEDIEV